MALPSSIIKSVIDLYRQGYSIVKIARVLNLHIEEVANVINEYA
jgi:transposase-like protein